MIRYKNFLSSGNVWSEIKLNEAPNTLVIGDNGAGKSTMLDALCFTLFNKPFRSITKKQLVNSVNQSKTVAEVIFSIGSQVYKVRRGIKPNIFEIEINGKLQNQDAAARDYQDYLEDSILKLNYTSFTQIVILGSSTFVPFMQLPAMKRREIIEDLLDIKIFSVMNVLVKEKMSSNRERLSDLNRDIESIKDKIKVRKILIDKMKEDKQSFEKDYKQKLLDTEKQIEQCNVSIERITSDISNKNELLVDWDNTKKKFNTLRDFSKTFRTKVDRVSKEVKFYETNEECPTCQQEIDKNFIEKKMDELTETKTRNEDAIGEAKKQIENLATSLEKYTNISNEITKNNAEVSKFNSDISALTQYKTTLLSNLQENSSKQSDVETEKAVVKELATQGMDREEKKKGLLSERSTLSYCSDLLRDSGVKTRIIKQYIPIMNKLINKYLASMDFFVDFEIDEEFNETIRSRHRDSFKYASFSEGEKMRIDLALLLTWRSIAKMKNSTNTNLLILDEVFDASLDSNGCEDFLKLLHDIGKDTNVFTISHKGDVLQDKFSNVIRFVKERNFSRVAV
jgi:DNA repair exonuclease SbcCD ATPase subunit